MNDQIKPYADKSMLLEQYKLIVNSFESAQQRRINLNNVFVLIYSVIIGLYSLLANDSAKLVPHKLAYSAYSIFIIGIVVGIFWVNIILQAMRSEKNKYRIIHKLESDMPIRLFSVSDLNEVDGAKKKLFNPGYLELALPLFMIAVLASNFIIIYFRAVI